MKKIILIVSLAVAGFASLASVTRAEPISIYTGTKGGGYDAKAKQIAARISQRGIQSEIINRNGSDDITLQACQNEKAMWIAQGDALYKREMKDGCYLSVVADYGDETAMLMFPPGSDNSKLKHLGSSDKLFVAAVGSGSELTARNMQSIEVEHGRGDDWAKTEIVTGDLRRLNALANRGRVTAALLVMKPTDDRISKLLDTGWTLGSLYDKDINDLQWGEKPLYQAIKYSVKVGSKTKKADGYVVKSFIGTTEAIENDNLETFDAILSALE